MFFQYLLRRLISIIAIFIVITFCMNFILTVFPPSARVSLVMEYSDIGGSSEEELGQIVSNISQEELDKPFILAYIEWLGRIFRGDWGYSWALNDNVFSALVRLAPTTLELTFYSLLFIIPLSFLTGLLTGLNPDKAGDHIFRGISFSVTSIPLFILAITLLAIFYVNLGWLAPGRISIFTQLDLNASRFIHHTGFLTLDSILNQRFDVLLEAWKHLALPVISIGLGYWAVLSRITRASAMEELNKDYIIMARAKGVPNRLINWRHILRNAINPSLTSTALSATSMVTGIFVVEMVFNFPGISQFIIFGFRQTDVAAVMGFVIYSIVSVLTIMLLLDLVQALINPRFREEIQ